MSIIKKITAEATFSVRNPVLRPNLPVESCHFEGDHCPSTAHLGYYQEKKLVGIVSVFEKANANWQNSPQIQIRGMAVLEDFQKKGIGEKLIQTIIKEALDNKTELIWFNARKNAVPFYEKLGFHIYGTEFEIEGVGTHFLMYRVL
jgi:GNAT superfamily N-acetyltransferase